MTQPELPGMPPSRQLVGFAYASRTGKDTAAFALVRDLGYTKFAFADALKDLAMEVDPIVLPIPGYQNVSIGHNRLAHVVHMTGWEQAKDRYPEVRKFLENLGNGCRKQFGEGFWLDLTMAKVGQCEKAVISDVRFANEAAAIKAAGGKLVKIMRPGHGPRPFETELDDWDDWDGTLDNSGSIPDLEQAAVDWARAAFRG